MAPRRCVPFFSWGWGLPPGCLCIIDILHEGPTQSWALQCPVRRARSSWERRWLGREYSARRPRKLACQRALRLNGRKQFSWGMRSSACARGLQNVGLAQETEERGVLLVPAGRGSASSPSRGCKPTCGETRSFHRYIHTHGQKFKSSPSPPLFLPSSSPPVEAAGSPSELPETRSARCLRPRGKREVSLEKLPIFPRGFTQKTTEDTAAFGRESKEEFSL